MSTIKEYFNLERTVRENTKKLNKLASVEDVSELTEKVNEVVENVNVLNEDVGTLKGDMVEVKGNVGTLAGVAKTVQTITFKITPDDWNGSLEYTYENEALGLDKLIEVIPTTDGTVVDGVTVTGNAVYIGSFVIEPTAQTSEGQLTFKAQSTPTVNVYITLVLWSNGISLE